MEWGETRVFNKTLTIQNFSLPIFCIAKLCSAGWCSRRRNSGRISSGGRLTSTPFLSVWTADSALWLLCGGGSRSGRGIFLSQLLCRSGANDRFVCRLRAFLTRKYHVFYFNFLENGVAYFLNYIFHAFAKWQQLCFIVQLAAGNSSESVMATRQRLFFHPLLLLFNIPGSWPPFKLLCCIVLPLFLQYRCTCCFLARASQELLSSSLSNRSAQRTRGQKEEHQHHHLQCTVIQSF